MTETCMWIIVGMYLLGLLTGVVLAKVSSDY